MEPAGKPMNAPFTALVRDAFAFLREAGFEVSATDARAIEFRSTDVIVLVSRSDRSGEIDVTFGLIEVAASAGHYSLYDILAMEGVNGLSGPRPPQIADASRLGDWLRLMADDCLAHASPAIRGDRKFFSRLESFRHAQALRLTRDLRLRQIRAEIERAWHAREMDKVAALYDSIEPDLDAAEKLKRDYARKHLND